MPKSTFFNLPEEKREKILQVAIDEFVQYSYHQASINRIVEEAEIAKGSFYQYFEDKKDLFKYIIEKSGEKKLEYLGHILKDLETLNFFQMIRELYITGIRFAKEHPKLSAIADRFMKDNDRKLMEEILGDSKYKGQQLFQGLLIRGIQKGEIDPKIDVELVAVLVMSMNLSISEYFLKEKKKDDLMEMMDVVDKMLYVIENGIKAKKEGE
ncbi:TetR/AcrR family transcriptional regulator [Thermotalea metallivorans]|uniref:Fatty acid metabolism regulator protein n=1 Tax=Thermotalea metallivorans TaxID=520762 RepID=A0A140LA90_9FIRM|nr:TetR/AcrR family transcriptional regulator [Thermotalea metallivorans]KXG77465.1 Fatty acid metabolism regulator protein [Thermotalea metallivorans]